MLSIIEPQIDLNTYSSEFFLGFYMANNESKECTLYVHTMKKSPVTFNVISLDDNFSYIYGYN